MRVIAGFDFGGSKFQVAHLQSLDKVQLWHFYGGQWEIGHSKEIPQGMTAGDVAAAMQQFIFGDLTGEEYKQLLPR